MKVLCVCLGNICRSPAAEAVLRDLAPDWTIDSAGTAGWHIGKPPYGPMQDASRARGLDMSGLRARQFQPDDFNRFDLILAMDAENLADIERQRPPGATTEVRLFAGQDVPDPYYTRDFDGALDLITKAARDLISDTNALPSG